MSFSMMRVGRLGLWLGAAGTVVASGAQAQSSRPAQFPAGAVVQTLAPDNGAELRRHLITLGDNPRSLDALIGAGRAALGGGDTQAALTFFSRAGEVAPGDPRVKAGMASVLVRMERGQPALNLFAEAASLGAPLVEIAGDRGLAYDMIGDPRRAQQDYALVLQRREDAEIRRRLALSLAISGEREAALRVIDGQLRRNDRAAWRTQAFIMALSGDPDGANRTAQGLMPAAAAQAMAPFFARLSTLNASQKAMAAHFGRFPNHNRHAAAGTNDIGADPGALALANGGQATRPRAQPTDSSQPTTRRRPGSSQSSRQSSEARASARTRQPREVRSLREIGENPSPREQRRVAEARERQAAPQASSPPPAAVPSATAGSLSAQRFLPTPVTNRAPVRAAPAVSQSAQSQLSGAPIGASGAPPNSTIPSTLTPSTPVQTSASVVDPQVRPTIFQPSGTPTLADADQASGSNQATASVSTARPPTSATLATAGPADLTPAQPPRDSVASAVQSSSSAILGAPSSTASSQSAASQSAPGRAGSLSDIAELVAALPQDEARTVRQSATTRPTPSRPAQTQRGDSQPPGPPATTRTRPGHPSRHWVQIAGGANAAALPRELARLRGLAPDLANRDAWVTPANATNRLLVGPFASTSEAQEFVNTLARRNLTAFVWTSAGGQEIARLRPGR